MDQRQLRQALALIGRVGGESGTGKAKRRGDSEHYARLARKAAKARAANREKELKP